MKIKEIRNRCNDGEVVILETIEDRFPDEYIGTYPETFSGLTIEDEFNTHGIVWIYDKEIRSIKEYDV